MRPGSESVAKKERAVQSWSWPPAPRSIDVYDKYSNTTSTLSQDAAVWSLKINGIQRNIAFDPGASGALQRLLVLSTKKNQSSPAVYGFSNRLVKYWDVIRDALEAGPQKISTVWDSTMPAGHVASAAKTVLRHASLAGVGPWRPAHIGLIDSLPTNAWKQQRASTARIRTRAHLLPAATRASIVGILDRVATEPRLDSADLEGFCALALMFQQGVRPGQAILLNVRDVYISTDADGRTNCVVSLLPMKRKATTKLKPVFRTIKAEWASLFVRLKAVAESEARQRMLSSESVASLKSKLDKACSKLGLRVEFRAGQLRHSATQALADAGQSRESIRRFLMHRRQVTAGAYHSASTRHGERINEALGASKIYTRISAIADGQFISQDGLAQVPEDEQVGGLVGDRLVAGIGRCQRKQKNCIYDPVVSCYGCNSFIPCNDLEAHVEAVGGMRAQVKEFLDDPTAAQGPAVLQLREALAGAASVVARLKKGAE